MNTKFSPIGQSQVAKFEVNAALFEELGERLVSKPEVSLVELIKNGYDADAHTCWIDFESDAIQIIDDGHGMTEHAFLNHWMVVSTQAKGIDRYSRQYKRSMAGSKGVGRFSARYLGHGLKLVSIADDAAREVRTKITANFDWRKITQEKNIDNVRVTYTVELAKEGEPCGTTLIISPLRQEAKRISIAQIKSDILRLTDPVAGLEPPPFSNAAGTDKSIDPGFSVLISGSGQNGSDDDTSLLQSEILDSYVGRVRMSVDDGTLSYKVFWRDEEAPIAEDEIDLYSFVSGYALNESDSDDLQESDELFDDAIFNGDLFDQEETYENDPGQHETFSRTPNLPVATELNSPLFIDLRFFPYRQGTFSGLSVNGQVARRWIKDHASISIVDNRFSMAAYSDPASDWLEINASKSRSERNWQSIFMPAFFPMSAIDRLDTGRNPMLALPTVGQLLGRIHIATRKTPLSEMEDLDTDAWLQPNMDRESLRLNGAFRLLWHIGRFAVELLAHFDRKRRLEEAEKEYEESKEDVSNDLFQLITEVRQTDAIPFDLKNYIVKRLEETQVRQREIGEYEREARTSLELMSTMGVMAGFMTHEFEKAMHSLSLAAEKVSDLASVDSAFKQTADEITEIGEALANQMDYMRLFVAKARRPQPQSFKALPQVKLVLSNLAHLADSYSIKVHINESSSDLAAPFIPLAAYHGILINLLSNSIKALIPKATLDRKILVDLSNQNDIHHLTCADNGVGIPSHLRLRVWDPLFSTTSEDNPMGSGLGLGLSVVRQVVEGLGGTIYLMDTAPEGFVTAFKVELPLQKH